MWFVFSNNDARYSQDVCRMCNIIRRTESEFLQKQTQWNRKLNTEYFSSETAVDKGATSHTSGFRARDVLSVMTAGNSSVIYI